MLATEETLLKRAICARSGLSEMALGVDVGLYSAGVGAEDLEGAFIETCGRVGVDPDAISSDAAAGSDAWLLTSLRHLGPFWPAAELARRELAGSIVIPAEPTIRSLAETIRRGHLVPAGPDVPVPMAPALSSGQVALRAASLGILTPYAAPVLRFLTCEPVCKACPVSAAEAMTDFLPTGLAVFAVIAAAVLLPGLLHLRHAPRPVVAG